MSDLLGAREQYSLILSHFVPSPLTRDLACNTLHASHLSFCARSLLLLFSDLLCTWECFISYETFRRNVLGKLRVVNALSTRLRIERWEAHKLTQLRMHNVRPHLDQWAFGIKLPRWFAKRNIKLCWMLIGRHGLYVTRMQAMPILCATDLVDKFCVKRRRKSSW